MKFFNRYIFMFTAFISTWTILFYALLIPLVSSINEKADHHTQMIAIIVISILYGVSMFLTGLLVGKKDIYKGHIGFNYHFMTYVVCVSGAWVAQLLFAHVGGALSMTLTWAIGIIIHFFIWLGMRKKNVRGYDKDELFE